MPNTPTPSSVSVTLFVAAAGAGLLSYPYAVKQQGILVNIVSTLVCAYVTVFTDLVLISTAALMRYGGAMKGEHTFEALAGAALGPHARTAAFVSILLGTGGSMVGFLIVIGDLLEAPLREVTGCSVTSPADACFLTSRSVLIPIVAIIVVLPLASLRALATMRHSSALAAATVLVIAGVVVNAGGRALASGNLTNVATTTRAPNHDGANDIVIARGNFVSFFLGFPILLFTLGNHPQVVPAYLEAEPGGAATRGITSAVYVAVGACVLLYGLTGVGGYLAFRTATFGDVLLNLSASDPAALVAKVLLAIHVALAFPVMIFPAREAIAAAVARWALVLADKPPPKSPVATAVRAVATRFTQFAASPPTVAASLTVIATIFAVSCPQVSVVFGLVGATVATFQIHLIPALYLWAWAAAREGRTSALVARGGGEVKAWTAVERLASGGWGGDTERLMGGEETEPIFSSNDDAVAIEPALRFLSFSPSVLRAQSIALVCTFVLVAVSGTSAYLVDTFHLMPSSL